MQNRKIKNIAIIAHVDHGKTTLVDSLLKQSGQVKEYQEMETRAMDSNEIEKERGITILAKCTSICWKDYLINVVDTPGHADFGGEVERILCMVDGCIVLVDSAEGPLPQTKFVLTKALALNLKPIVVINKVDRKDARIDEVIDEVYELFMSLDATSEQLDFKILYASGRNGWASLDKNVQNDTLTPLFDTILQEIPDAQGNIEEPTAMLATLLEVDPYLGILLTGKLQSGVLEMNMPIKALDLDGNEVERGRVTKILKFEGLKKVAVDRLEAGNIAIVAGLKKATVTHTLCALDVATPIKAQPIDPPTLSINMTANDSPFAGNDGKKCTLRMIGDRLNKEIEKNIALKIREISGGYEVSGRGELHLGILIETMRREGFEMNISKPQVIMKIEDKVKLEPIETVTIDVDNEYSGIVTEKMSIRKGNMLDMRQGDYRTRLIFEIPTRGLIGYHSQFLTDTRGTGIMNRLFKGYEEYKGEVPERINGSLIASEQGVATEYAIFNLQDRGKFFIAPGEKVYMGMIVGEHSKDSDLEINVVKAKQLTNIRSAGKDDSTKCQPHIVFTIEDAISYIANDELLEVTPKSLRLRKKFLSANERKRSK